MHVINIIMDLPSNTVASRKGRGKEIKPKPERG